MQSKSRCSKIKYKAKKITGHAATGLTAYFTSVCLQDDIENFLSNSSISSKFGVSLVGASGYFLSGMIGVATDELAENA